MFLARTVTSRRPSTLRLKHYEPKASNLMTSCSTKSAGQGDFGRIAMISLFMLKHLPPKSFFVGIEIGPNDEELFAGRDGTLLLPKSEDHLHYVVRTGQVDGVLWGRTHQTHEIEGCYVRRVDAIEAARYFMHDTPSEIGSCNVRESHDTSVEVREFSRQP